MHALAGIDLTVRRGEFVSIIGPSGCGKTTLLRIIGGLQEPDARRVLIDGRPPREAQREKQLGFVFQDPSLLPWRSVIENVRLPLQVNRRRDSPPARTRSAWSTSSASVSSAATTRTSSPAACSSAWPWRAPSSRRPPCC